MTENNETTEPAFAGDTLLINVYMTLPVADLQQGWAGDLSELEASISATLHEIVGDDGNVYVPKVFGIDTDVDDAASMAKDV